MSFDLDAFLSIKGKTGTGTVQALGMSFGMPSCMLNLASNAMNLLPSNLLSKLYSQIQAGEARAQAKIKAALKAVHLDTGIMEINTLEGVFKYIGTNAWSQIEEDEESFLADLGGVVGSFNAYLETGIQLYENIQGIAADVQGAIDCLDKWNELEKFQGGSSASQKSPELNTAKYAAAAVKIKSLEKFTKKCSDTRANISSILEARAADPSLEPKFLDTAALDQYLDGTTYDRVPLDDPGVDDDEVFRLVYGPPVSQDGHYLLTADGLYYDSQKGGLDPIYLAISGVVPPGDKWKYDYDSNLGGKGESVSLHSLNAYTDNLFDPAIIDESLALTAYYEEDHFLSVLKQQRNKHIFDLSGDLQNYISDPAYGEDSSVVRNQRQLIISEIANHDHKISKRKKQIELSVKIPGLYGGEGKPLFMPGKVPINDFSFLEKYNLVVDLEKQKTLSFDAGEVTGVVLPLDPIFVVSPPTPPSVTYEHLYVPPVGTGSILYSPSASPSGTLLSLTDEIITDDLFAIYNFLESDVVLPSSIDFLTTNCASENQYNSCQLVAPSNKAVFFSGLSIPYFEGIVRNKGNDVSAASGLGSFIKLPSTKEFRELTYSPSGFTFECWAHVPNIMEGEAGWLSSTTSSLTKVLLGCENVGVREGASALDHTGAFRDLDFLENKKGEDFARGMIMGFSRDRRITQASAGYEELNAKNDPASSLSFFIAPTQARDFSSCSWINNDDCQDYATFYKMKVDLSATTFGSVSSQFVLIDVTVDPAENKVRFYADGALVATSGLDLVFGVKPYTTPNLPSFKKLNSFEYTTSTVDVPHTLQQGPKLDPFYTPWVVGGGYTDGMYKYGNFMGGKEGNGSRGGFTSGLRGFMGSVKFYKKPLKDFEIYNNYKAQKGFFKNIKT